MRKALLSLVLLLLPAVAHAQEAPPARPPPAPTSTSTIAVPPPPIVSDPMLAPVPAPRRVLSSWQEAVVYLRARSTDLKIALDQVLQAQALTRIPLAQHPPSLSPAAAMRHQVNTSSGI